MLTILLVDDSETFRKLLVRIFSKNPNFEIAAEAPSGQEALLMLESLQPDIILLDLSMPDMDGLTFLSTLNKKFLGKIAIFSGIPRADIEEVCYAKGADAYIEKGTSIGEIFEKLENLQKK